jgi:hypothetical protein
MVKKKPTANHPLYQLKATLLFPYFLKPHTFQYKHLKHKDGRNMKDEKET